MEDRMVAIIFDDEKKAYEGLKALEELNSEGSITLYASAVIAKDAGGKVIVRRTADQGPLGTSVGLLAGSLIGLFGGPAGLAIGAAAGTTGGMFYDMAKAGVGGDFLTEAGQQLQPGKTAIVAEIWEEWITPLDSRMEALGGRVFRRARGEFLDSQIERDATAFKGEVSDLKAENSRVGREAKAKIEGKINAVKSRLKATQDHVKAALEANKLETDAKIKSLKSQVAKAQGEAKSKMEAHIAELQSDGKRRADKLNHAWEEITEALAV